MIDTTSESWTIPPNRVRAALGVLFFGLLTGMALIPLVLVEKTIVNAPQLFLCGLAILGFGAGFLFYARLLLGLGPSIVLDAEGITATRFPWLKPRRWRWSDFGDFAASGRYIRWNIQSRMLCAHYADEHERQVRDGKLIQPTYRNAAAIISIDLTAYSRNDRLAVELAEKFNDWRRKHSPATPPSLHPDVSRDVISERENKRKLREASQFLGFMFLAPFLVIIWLLLR